MWPPGSSLASSHTLNCVWLGVTFTAILAGDAYNCGIRPEATLECWGDNTYGQTLPPEGRFMAIELGTNLGCGIGLEDLRLRC